MNMGASDRAIKKLNPKVTEKPVRSAGQREIARLRGKLAMAEKIIDVQENSPRCLGLRCTARRWGERMSAGGAIEVSM